MRIVFIVYHDLQTEARSQDTLKALEKIGHVTVVSQNELPEWSCSKSIVVPYNNQIEGIRYIKFLNMSKKIIKELKPDIVLLHDAVNLIPYVKHVSKKSRIVCDQSELMVDRKNSSIKLLLLNIIDSVSRKYLKEANLVICANEERAIITQFYFKLKNKPYVFENVHKINDDYNAIELNTKYKRYLGRKWPLIVYGGGVSKARKTYDLINSIAQLKNVKLIIAGSTPEGLDEMNALLSRLNLKDRVEYIGFVPRAEWRYLLSIADISFVAFEKNCWNSIYCASGKAFESLFEGTPILCSNNPPLQRMCESKKIGIASDDYISGIKKLLDNIEEYKRNALLFAKELNYDESINLLSDEIEGANK